MPASIINIQYFKYLKTIIIFVFLSKFITHKQVSLQTLLMLGKEKQSIKRPVTDSDMVSSDGNKVQGEMDSQDRQTD